ncbi:hypothetical protein G5C60_44355 [Streptomyces sp. HC44]|uniref:Uncharacterized protein n=1 Tax=Streptomyces scabichelini TaxID=2711217 RepID=A0A6G4VKX7_9ACTN|nr:hypothetical protein [Streptomyces scabichelini]NGO14444.1 hypothetical protein [Streptomyces scabichelini]
MAHAHGLLVLTLRGSALTRFVDNSLLHRFGLPHALRPPTGAYGVIEQP